MKPLSPLFGDYEVDCLDVIKEGARIDRLGLIPEYSCAASDRKVLRTWNR